MRRSYASYTQAVFRTHWWSYVPYLIVIVFMRDAGRTVSRKWLSSLFLDHYNTPTGALGRHRPYMSVHMSVHTSVHMSVHMSIDSPPGGLGQTGWLAGWLGRTGARWARVDLLGRAGWGGRAGWIPPPASLSQPASPPAAHKQSSPSAATRVAQGDRAPTRRFGFGSGAAMAQ